MNYNSIIKKIRRKKYQNYLNLKRKFFLSYIKSRSDLIKKLDKIKYTKNIDKQNIFLKTRKDNKIETFKMLNLILKNLIKIKKLVTKILI